MYVGVLRTTHCAFVLVFAPTTESPTLVRGGRRRKMHYREPHISPRGQKKKDASGSSANRCTWLSNGNAASLATGRRAWLQMKKGKGHGSVFCHFSPFPISKSVILTTLSFQRSQQRNENSARWSIPIDKREGISNLGRASFFPVHKGVERY